MADLSALSKVTTTATALSNLILVTPQSTVGYQPQNAKGVFLPQPPAILFHYEGEQFVTLESDITDHFIEDNTAIVDQIALKPILVNTHGYIGELNDIAPPLLNILKTLADKLIGISAFTPELSVTAQVAYNNAFQLYQVGVNAVNSAVAAWASVTGQGGTSVIDENGITKQMNQTKQQLAFQQFYGYWSERTLFTVQTPWAVFENMAIKSLRAIQDADSKVITDFEVSFKMIRTADTLLSLSATSQGRFTQQAADVNDLGTSTPPSSMSLTSGLGNMGVA